MCDPLTATFATLQVAGAVQGASSANKAGKANAAYYKSLADANEVAAGEVLKAGRIKENMAQAQAGRDTEIIQRESADLRAKQVAIAAANGMGAGSVTAEDIGSDTLTRQRMDELAIRYNADMDSWAAKTDAQNQAWDLRSQAGFNRQSAVNARQAGRNNAIASLIGGATSLASTAYTAKKFSTPKTQAVPTRG